MRKNKRNISVILATVMLVICLCSCSSKSSEKDTQAAPDATAEIQKTEADTNAESAIMPVYTLEKHTDLESDGDLLLASGTYEVVRLTEEAKAAYPALDEAIEKLSAEAIEQDKKQFAEIKDAAVSSRENYHSDSEDFFPGEMTVRIEPVRCDGVVLSFIESCSLIYPDAGHGFMGYSGHNYDSATGAAITLADVVTDLSAVLPVAAENLVSQMDGMPVTAADGALEQSFDNNGENLVWVLDSDALVLRFAPYEVAAYAYGTIEARIPYVKYPDLFTGKYGPYNGAFAKKLNPYMHDAADLNGDGEAEPVYVTASYEADGSDAPSYSGLEVTAGTMSCTEKVDYNDRESVLLHTADGRNIILVETTSDSDFTDMYVFEAADSGLSLIGKLEGMGFAQKYHAEDDYDEVYTVLDPSRFALKEWSDTEDTEVVFYGIGEDGMPSPLAE